VCILFENQLLHLFSFLLVIEVLTSETLVTGDQSRTERTLQCRTSSFKAGLVPGKLGELETLDLAVCQTSFLA
jgi:hypothetical protein